MPNKKSTKSQSTKFAAIFTHKFILLALAILALLTAAFFAWRTVIPQTFRLDETYYGGSEFWELNADTYNQLIKDRASFIVFIDQPNCITANKLREMLTHIADKYQIYIYHMMWSDVKTTSLRDNVKFYPSVAIIHQGKVADALDAESDAHVAYYNSEPDLESWLAHYIEL